MAEKRMFTQKIVDSDAFLDMPLSTQALYFHLNMHADDDGFVNNPKRIQRDIGASVEDLKLLIANRFVLTFENGVIVIKHWRMHNLLRKDRYHPTQYQDEMEKLRLKDNGAYTEKVSEPLATEKTESVATTWQPDGNQMAHRIGKDRIEKDRIGEVRKEESRKSVTCQKVVDLYHSICVSYPRVIELSEARKRAIRARLKVYTLEQIKTVFEKAEASVFMKGANDHDWTADFDWMLKDANIVKVLEGKYDNGSRKKKTGESRNASSKNKFNNFHQRDYDMGALEQKLLEKDQGVGG